MKTIDVCGLSCPEPVVRTQFALNNLPQGEQLVVVVDTVTARENVLRTAQAMNCTVSLDENGKQFTLTLTKNS